MRKQLPLDYMDRWPEGKRGHVPNEPPAETRGLCEASMPSRLTLQSHPYKPQFPLGMYGD